MSVLFNSSRVYRNGYLLQVGGSGIYGLCAVARVALPANMVIVQYMGRWTVGNIPQDQEHGLPHNRPGFLQNLYVDARREGNISRLMAHSETPNCRYETWLNGGELVILIITIEEITAGTPVTLQYPQLRNVRCSQT